MANDQGISPGGVVVAFIAGAAVGAAVALLFAPATGEQTREYLSQRAREGRERATRRGAAGTRDAEPAARQHRHAPSTASASSSVRQARLSAQGGAGRVNDVFLGTIAVAVLVMAVDPGGGVRAGRHARRRRVGDADGAARAGRSARSSRTCRRCRRMPRGPRHWQRRRSSARTRCSRDLRERIDETVQSVQESS